MLGSCPCVQARDGVFVLAAGVYAAVWSPVFLGADFGALVVAFLNAPTHPPLALVIWAAVIATGLVMLCIGIYEHLHDGDSAPVPLSVLAMIVCGAAMHFGWYLPRDWGVLWMRSSQGFYVAVISAGGANLLVAVSALIWNFGFSAAIGHVTLHGPAGGYSPQWQDVNRHAAEIEDLRGKYQDLLARNNELEAILRFPDVRRSILKVLHPDTQPRASDGERRQLTERFQKASAVLNSLGSS
jgi:hypothetical protein